MAQSYLPFTPTHYGMQAYQKRQHCMLCWCWAIRVHGLGKNRERLWTIMPLPLICPSITHGFPRTCPNEKAEKRLALEGVASMCTLLALGSSPPAPVHPGKPCLQNAPSTVLTLAGSRPSIDQHWEQPEASVSGFRASCTSTSFAALLLQLCQRKGTSTVMTDLAVTPFRSISQVRIPGSKAARLSTYINLRERPQ